VISNLKSMKRITCIILLLTLWGTGLLEAQNQKSQSQQKASNNKETLQGQETNSQSQQKGTHQEAGKNTRQQSNSNNTEEGAVDHQGTGDTPGAAEAAAATNNDRQAGGDQQRTESNAPPVIQTTTSSSGSPGVLAEENGKQRDGTNNVQRASMNMVGSPVGNLNLGNARTVDADTELRDRQNYSQEKQVSAQNQNQSNAGNTSGQSEQINNNNRKQNNAASDQNLSSKEKNASGAGGNNKKKQNNQTTKKQKG
jgi:hypothetical protein